MFAGSSGGNALLQTINRINGPQSNENVEKRSLDEKIGRRDSGL
jgi:hypothetical protein